MTTSNVSRNKADAARLELARRHPEDLALWAEAYRRFDGKPMQLSPQLRSLYQDNHRVIVIQKAAQVGISEYLVNLALWSADTGWGGRGNALYTCPRRRWRMTFPMRGSARPSTRVSSPPAERVVGVVGEAQID